MFAPIMQLRVSRASAINCGERRDIGAETGIDQHITLHNEILSNLHCSIQHVFYLL
jgi:hypothetical protein